MCFSSAQESFKSNTFSELYSKFNLIVSPKTLVKTHTSEAPWVYNCKQGQFTKIVFLCGMHMTVSVFRETHGNIPHT